MGFHIDNVIFRGGGGEGDGDAIVMRDVWRLLDGFEGRARSPWMRRVFTVLAVAWSAGIGPAAGRCARAVAGNHA